MALADRLADDGAIVSMQNGLGNIESLIGTFGARRVLGARVIFGAEMRSPGSAHVTVFAQPVAIGPAPALQREDASALVSHARAIAAILDAAGVPAVGVDDIMPVLWTKILYNVALNPLGALLRLHYGALAEDPDARQIMDRAIDEAFAVAHALGVALPFSNAAEYRKVFLRGVDSADVQSSADDAARSACSRAHRYRRAQRQDCRAGRSPRRRRRHESDAHSN